MEGINKPLNRKEVNGYDMVNYLSELGHEPQKIRGEDYWYLSPLRKERTASFKVFRKGNVWYDHGSGEGGNLVAFCLAYFRCSEEELLERFNSQAAHQISYQSSAFKNPDDPDSHIQIKAVQPLTSVYLKHYLTSRNISADVGQKYCKEVTFSLYRKTYQAIGFLNRFGGYELRNAGFKGSSSPKDITLLETSANNIAVFEGFFDFLSHQTALLKTTEPSDYLILNSLSFTSRAAPFLEPYSSIELYLDYGATGRQQTQKLLTQFPKAIDKSNLYKGFDDLNEWHCQSKQTTFSSKKMKVKR